jgi:hypothetical protein
MNLQVYQGQALIIARRMLLELAFSQLFPLNVRSRFALTGRDPLCNALCTTLFFQNLTDLIEARVNNVVVLETSIPKYRSNDICASSIGECPILQPFQLSAALLLLSRFSARSYRPE